MCKMSIVVPCYNEEESIDFFYKAMKELQHKLTEVEMELIFIDDGSKDRTYEKVTALYEQDHQVKCISFSKNFGKEAAIFSGLRAATGECCVVMDADLQHPPETIIEMYEQWKKGYEVVEGIKLSRGKESRLHKWFADVFYGVLGRIIGIDMKNTSDFKLLDRKAIDALSNLKERDTFFRALSYWVGFKSATVSYEVKERVAGNTKWSFLSLCSYAIKNLIAFSFAPLYFIIFIGIVVLAVGAGFGIDALITYIKGIAVGGYPTLVFLILIAAGGIMLSLGIVGIYIAKIYEQIKDRPQYIISDKKE